MSAITLTGNQSWLARHCLGLSKRKQSYRNHHYSTEVLPVFEEMVAAGLATVEVGFNTSYQRRYIYRVTKACAEAALLPGESLDAVSDRWAA